MYQQAYSIKSVLLGSLSIFLIIFIIPIIIINVFYDANMDYFDYISQLVTFTFFAITILFCFIFFILFIFHELKKIKPFTTKEQNKLKRRMAFLTILVLIIPIYITIILIPLYKDLPLLINKDFSYCEWELIKITSKTGRGAHNDAYICNMKFEISSDLKDSLVPGNKYKVTYLPNSNLLIKFEEK